MIFRSVTVAIGLLALPLYASNTPLTVFHAVSAQEWFRDTPRCVHKHIPVVYESELWASAGNSNGVPADEAISKAARSRRLAPIVVLDIERWSLDERYLAESSAKLLDVLGRFRRDYPGAIGFYGIVPNRDYWNATGDESSAEYRGWVSRNSSLRDLAAAVDVVFPSLYTFYPDWIGWHRFAKRNLAEAKRLASGKIVIPFLWPRYHDSSADAYEYIGDAYLAFQLDVVRKEVGRTVIWDHPAFVDKGDWRAGLEKYCNNQSR